MYKIKIAKDNKIIAEKNISKKLILIGRSKDCDVVILDPKVSRHHCSLEIVDKEKCRLKDLMSTYGTYIKDKKINEKYITNPQDIKIYEYCVTIEWDESFYNNQTELFQELFHEKTNNNIKYYQTQFQDEKLSDISGEYSRIINTYFNKDYKSEGLIDNFNRYHSLIIKLVRFFEIVFKIDPYVETQKIYGKLNQFFKEIYIDAEILFIDANYNEILKTNSKTQIYKTIVNDKKIRNVIFQNKPVLIPNININNVEYSVLTAHIQKSNDIQFIILSSNDIHEFNKEDFFIFVTIVQIINILFDNIKLFKDTENIKTFNENIISQMYDGLIVTNNQLKIKLINKPAKEILNVKRKEFNKENLLIELIEKKKILLTDRINIPFEIEIKHGDTIKIIEFIINQLTVRNIKYGYIFLIRDITDYKSMQRKYIQSQKLSGLGQMAASIAHEIRNPFHSVHGFLEIIKKNIRDDTNKKYIDIIFQEMGRINLLIQNMLDLTKPIKYDFVKWNIVSIIEQMIEKYETINDKVKFIFFHDKNEIIWSIDVMRFEQVISNLIKNSIEATEKQNTTIITIKLEELDDTIKISFTDNGPGIEEDYIKKIFEPFTSNKKSGTGLGLTISQKIIDALGGTLEYDSNYTDGGRFVITFYI